MSANTHDAGQLSLPFVGSCTFGKGPYRPEDDVTRLPADKVRIVGVGDLTGWIMRRREG